MVRIDRRLDPSTRSIPYNAMLFLSSNYVVTRKCSDMAAMAEPVVLLSLIVVFELPGARPQKASYIIYKLQ